MRRSSELETLVANLTATLNRPLTSKLDLTTTSNSRDHWRTLNNNYHANSELASGRRHHHEAAAFLEQRYGASTMAGNLIKQLTAAQLTLAPKPAAGSQLAVGK